MSDDLTRALALFDDYADLPAAERERRLAALGARDPALQAALRALLESDDDDAGVLDRSPAQIVAAHQPPPATSPAATDAGEGDDESAEHRIGELLGVWRIDRIIGRGGMGTVYEAHRADGQYQQRVALKCIRSGLESPDLVAAFREERNLLARLEHPGIAGVVDGGIDPQGRPWFALRRVEGEPIDVWCDRGRLGPRARVDLLLQACDALAYAHAQGVLHRDIKPSNLLVTADGRVQLLDFGISTRFGGDDGANAHLAITPDYAAPEAHQHGIQGPATDLYMLGVLTYRLLCGQWPTRLHGLRELMPFAAAGAPEPMERLLDGGDDALARRHGHDTLEALRRELAGDLSAVALKAVAAKPHERYPSIAEFARDLRAWREHRPVSVRRGGWRERMRLWRRRNPVAPAMLAALALVIVAGTAAVIWQRQRVQREIASSQAVGHLFAATLGNATQSGLGRAPFSSRALLERSERELRAMRLDDQPALQARSLATLARSHAVIGDYRRADALAAEAVRALGDEDDRDGFIAATRLSMLNTQARYAEAERLAREWIAALDGGDDANARTAAITFSAELARAQWNLGHTEQAAATLAAAISRAADARPQHTELLAELLIQRSGYLRRLWRPAEAEADAHRALQLARPLNPVLADDALERYMLAAQLSGRPQAAALAAELVRRRTASLGASHPKTAYAIVRANVFASPDQPSYDLPKALAAIEAAYGTEHPEYASALSTAASSLTHDPAEAVRKQRAALAVIQRTLPANSEARLSGTFNLAQHLIHAPPGPDPRRDRAEGLQLLRDGIEAKRRAGLPSVLENYMLVDTLSYYGDDASLPELQSRLRDYRAQLQRTLPPDDYRFRYLRFQEAKLAYLLGQRESADRAFADYLRDERGFIEAGGRGRGALYDQHERSALAREALQYRGLHALSQCRLDEGEAFLDRAAALADSARVRDERQLRAARALAAGARNRRLPAADAQLLREPERARIERILRGCAGPRRPAAPTA